MLCRSIWTRVTSSRNRSRCRKQSDHSDPVPADFRWREVGDHGADKTTGIQAQGEYMFYPARQEGQLDAALLYRRGQWQLGAGGSFKSPALRSAPSTGGLSHATVTIDALLPTVRVGVFGAKGLKRMDVVELSELLGP